MTRGTRFTPLVLNQRLDQCPFKALRNQLGRPPRILARAGVPAPAIITLTGLHLDPVRQLRPEDPPRRLHLGHGTVLRIAHPTGTLLRLLGAVSATSAPLLPPPVEINDTCHRIPRVTLIMRAHNN
jgi:hypothetical protein